MDRAVSPQQLQQLRDGVVITTPVQRDRSSGKHKSSVTARTLPCAVDALRPDTLRVRLVEGRNRQIRRMAEAVQLTVLRLHRVSFAGIGMRGISRPGSWSELSEREMSIIQEALRRRYEGSAGKISEGTDAAEEEE